MQCRRLWSTHVVARTVATGTPLHKQCRSVGRGRIWFSRTALERQACDECCYEAKDYARANLCSGANCAARDFWLVDLQGQNWRVSRHPVLDDWSRENYCLVQV